MKKQIGIAGTLTASTVLALVLSTGCVVTPAPGTVYVREGPPAAVVEVQGIGPGPDFVWLPGFHRWDGSHHIWVSGHWEKRPHAAAVWEPGAWRHHHEGWYWTDGRWR